ncbi:MAG TPA: DUF6084 family protein [Candidatus Dormibacteraeota bacterium]|jgi:hypothetical protein|nr:DUF6084 family protein [Candidatus Dormibacteraeota bacterium]
MTAVPDLRFRVESAAAIPYAALPTLGFTLGVDNPSGVPVETVSLQVQVRIEATRRRYQAAEKERLRDLFGTPDRWGKTLHTFLWTHAATQIGSFTGSTTAQLPITCTFDFDVVATKYLYALEEGEVPTLLLFSGSIFFRDDEGQLQMTLINWDQEASYRLPVSVWKDVMNVYFPNTAWLDLHRDTFDQLLAYKTRHGIPTWDATLERLLSEAKEPSPA